MVSKRLANLIEEYGGLCHLCGEIVVTDQGIEHPGFPSRDHVKPRKYMKPGEMGRVALAHRVCNSSRNHRHIGKCEKEKFQNIYNQALEEYRAKTLMVDGVYSTEAR